MKLKDSQSLWGMPIIYLRECSKKYKLYSALLYLCDVAVVALLTIYMFKHNIGLRGYGIVLVVTCVLVHLVLYTRLSPEKWEAYNFYKRHMNMEVVEKRYDVDAQQLYSVLYCVGYLGLKQDKTLEYYKNLVLNYCCSNVKHCKTIMKYLGKHENANGGITCYILEKGKNQYFIDFKASLDEEGRMEEDGNDNRADA